MNEIKDDIKKAVDVIDSRNGSNFGSAYHDVSAVHKFTNENINSYLGYLENKKRVLAVTASGDQILTNILLGSEKIDSFDISRFPKYYFELKKAAVLSLSCKEFKEFFISNCSDNMFKKLYSEFNGNIDDKYKEFWDYLVQRYSNNLFKTHLFQVYSGYNNGYGCYLEEENYEILKEKLEDVKVKHYVGDIFNLVSKFTDCYDLVYLSNIIGYTAYDKYETLLSKFNLSEDGSIFTYLFNYDHNLLKYFRDDCYDIQPLEGKGYAMTYTKKVINKK